jgi:hypothetical protein
MLHNCIRQRRIRLRKGLNVASATGGRAAGLPVIISMRWRQSSADWSLSCGQLPRTEWYRLKLPTRKQTRIAANQRKKNPRP